MIQCDPTTNPVPHTPDAHTSGFTDPAGDPHRDVALQDKLKGATSSAREHPDDRPKTPRRPEMFLTAPAART
ncbi:hypothetical protein [Streptomyces sp. NBC_00076]|uniref:hypothetical protein n=1 Tax=Streptomyces sp. NBC_00076 TaxID=2975642 RepID=UPI003254A48E